MVNEHKKGNCGSEPASDRGWVSIIIDACSIVVKSTADLIDCLGLKNASMILMDKYIRSAHTSLTYVVKCLGSARRNSSSP